MPNDGRTDLALDAAARRRRCRRGLPCLLAALALTLAVALPSAAGAADCLLFGGLDTCALGGAVLTEQGGALAVDGLYDAAADGLAVPLDAAAWWYGQLRGTPATVGGRLVLQMHAAGVPAGQVTLRSTAGGVAIEAGFGAAAPPPSYSALVYKGGTFADGQGGIEPAGGGVMFMEVEADRCLAATHEELFTRRPKFVMMITGGGGGGGGGGGIGGSRQYDLEVDGTVCFVLPDGREVLGDRLRLVEEGPGQGPPAIDAITLHADVGAVEMFDQGASQIEAEYEQE